MHVDDLVAVSGNDLLAQHAQEPGQHHHINVMGLQNAQQGGVKIGAAGVVFAADNRRIPRRKLAARSSA